MPEGPVDMTAQIGDTILGAETIFSKAETVVISNIHIGELKGGATAEPFNANPTPADCK